MTDRHSFTQMFHLMKKDAFIAFDLLVLPRPPVYLLTLLFPVGSFGLFTVFLLLFSIPAVNMLSFLILLGFMFTSC